MFPFLQQRYIKSALTLVITDISETITWKTKIITMV